MQTPTGITLYNKNTSTTGKTASKSHVSDNPTKDILFHPECTNHLQNFRESYINAINLDDNLLFKVTNLLTATQT